ncbi:MAG: MBL fold metallo-hydrolase [Patescibacteria group bacterium]
MRVKPRHPLISSDKLRIAMLMCFVFLFSFASWIFSSAQTWPWQERPLKIWMLDVGQGDALLIEFPTGEEMLVDGGPGDAVLAKLGSVLPPWDRTLDALLLTHPDADHVTGILSVLDRYRVATIYESGVGAHTPFADAFVERVPTEESSHKLVQSGDVVTIGEVALTVLWPEETLEGKYPESRNNYSIAFLLTYGDTTVLFTADTEEQAEDVYASRAGNIDVLKVGHHGSLTSTSWNLLELTDPEVALISMGEDNSYGHPHPVILDRLKTIGAQIFRTDLDGDVLLTSYGGEPTVTASPLPF